MRTFIPKEHPDLPDSYGVTITFVGESKPIELILAGHRIVDKVYDYKKAGMVNVPFVVGPLACPLFEYETADDLIGSIPLSSIKHIQFNKDFSKICDLKEKVDKTKQ